MLIEPKRRDTQTSVMHLNGRKEIQQSQVTLSLYSIYQTSSVDQSAVQADVKLYLSLKKIAQNGVF